MTAPALARAMTLSLALVGCSAGTQLVASPSDYAAYRATRVGVRVEDRVAASHEYLARRPQGAFAAEVKAGLERAEPVLYAAKQGSVRGLEEFLRAYPDGAHAADARRLLARAHAERAEADALGAAASASEAAEQQRAAEREHARTEVVRWLGLANDVALFVTPVAQAPKAFITAWALALPEPTCTPASDADPGRRCTKLLELPFTVPTPKGPEARELLLEIALDEDPNGRPWRVTVGGPELFTRLEEIQTKRPESAADVAARAQAIADFRDLLSAALGVRGNRCEAPVVAPVVFDDPCGAVRAVATAGTADEPDDRVVFTRRPAR